MTTTTNPLVEDYLRRLDQAARVLPRREREELVAEIRGHLAVGLAPGASEAEVRNALDDLGTPEDIVAAAAPARPTVRRGAREVIALVLLVTGFPPLLGWLAGVVLLLLSPVWTGRQKLLGILVWPGGYVVTLAAIFLGLAVPVSTSSGSASPCVTTGVVTSCTGSSGGTPGWHFFVFAAAAAFVLIAPLVVAGTCTARPAGRARARRGCPEQGTPCRGR